MDVDGAQFDVAAAAPDGIEQLAAGKDAAGVFHEVAQQAEFGRTDLDRLRLRVTRCAVGSSDPRP
jgi:hypothetical protein